MGQVPMQNHFLLVGNGRTSQNFQNYFRRLELPFSLFSRKQPENWNDLVKKSTHVLLLISDDQIDAFFASHPEIHSKTCVHTSGALVHPQIPSAHPLMTFTKKLASDDLLNEMVFMIEEEGPSFETLLPGVPNSYRKIKRDLKAKYHAWCVMSGNFTTLLWEATAREFNSNLGLDQRALTPYLKGITKNLAAELDNPSSDSQLTGPFVRGDVSTIERNIAALSEGPFADVYRAFWSAYQQIQRSSL